ncbi:HNH endonuclease [Paenarthrobacter sp. TA1.8]|uniref:HNH endonuclease n=1 Tax=Paenarthrobacter sp. TA1.8 TaxID=3400219 RepID=UPI003B429F32
MNLSSLASDLSASLNLPISATSELRTAATEFRLNGLARPHGFSVVVTTLLSKVKAEFVLDRLAADLLRVVGEATPEEWGQTSSILQAYTTLGGDFKFRVNGRTLDDVLDSGIVPKIENITCTAVMNRTSHDDPSSDVITVAEGILSAIVCLLPLDDDQLAGQQLGPVDFYPEAEGLQYEVLTTRYERSRSNRAAAIAVHGRTCAVCEFNFDSSYGALAEGYVEIHHLVPVSRMGESRTVDPVSELIPLCSNCHRMAHRRWPPYTPDELVAARNAAS